MKDIIQKPEFSAPPRHKIHFPLFDDVEVLRLIFVDEASILRMPADPQAVTQAAQGFAEARAQAELWIARS